MEGSSPLSLSSSLFVSLRTPRTSLGGVSTWWFVDEGTANVVSLCLFHFHPSVCRLVYDQQKKFLEALDFYLCRCYCLCSRLTSRQRTRRVNRRPVRTKSSSDLLPLTSKSAAEFRDKTQGQTDPRVKFLSRGGGYTLFLTGDEAVLSLHKATGVAPHFGPARAGLKPGATTSVDQTTTDNGARTTNACSVRDLWVQTSKPQEPAPRNSRQEQLFHRQQSKKWRTNVAN